jgi:hypothetical protein
MHAALHASHAALQGRRVDQCRSRPAIYLGPMKRICVSAIFCLTVGQAQSPNPIVNEARFSWNTVRTNLIKMADKMPAEFYGFRPTPEIETFAQRLAHIVGADLGVCTGLLTNTARPLGRVSGTTKAELVTALNEAVTACDKAFDATTDKNAFEQVSSRLGGPFPPEPTRSRLATLNNMIRHSNELYGYMCVYLRLKGIVPPSSAPE